MTENTKHKDYEILDEAVRLVAEGIAVTFPVNGRSMLPFIVGGRESVILVKPRAPQLGDIVLARVENGKPVIHRIIAIDGEKVTLMGDGNLYGVEHCLAKDILARATDAVTQQGKKRKLDSASSLKRSALWNRLRPIRKWLLLLYRIKEKVKRS